LKTKHAFVNFPNTNPIPLSNHFGTTKLRTFTWRPNRIP